MLFKAMGLNPQELIEKGQQLATMLEQLGAVIQSKVTLIDSRLTRIEVQLALLTQHLQSTVEPAGETGHYELVPLAEETQESKQQKGHKTNGRYPGNSGTH